MKRKLQAIILSIFLICLTSTSAHALVPAFTQSQDYWCWVTVQQSLLQHNSISATQCNIYKASKGTTTCPDEGGTMAQTKYGLNYYNVSSTQYTGSLSWSSAKTYSASGYVIGWYWNTTSPTGVDGHMVVGEGYSEVITGGGYPAYYVKYMDPFSGTHETISYSSAVGGSSSDRTWIEGLYNVYKRPF